MSQRKQLDTLDSLLAEIDSIIAIPNSSEHIARRNLINFMPNGEQWELNDLSPFSSEYKLGVRGLFERISGRPHSNDDEGHVGLDKINSAFPFYLAPDQAGYWTIIFGHLLYKLGLKRGAQVLEVGFGPGGLTEVLARSGLNLTAIEIQPFYADFLDQRISKWDLKAEIRCEDALTFSTGKRFDAIIFFEAFHHLVDHADILAHLVSFLAERGRVVLGAEPIVGEGEWMVPFPWGPRIDVPSVYTMRRNGWMELGFRQSYIRDLFARNGLSFRHEFLSGYHHSKLWIGEKIVDQVASANV